MSSARLLRARLARSATSSAEEPAVETAEESEPVVDDDDWDAMLANYDRGGRNRHRQLDGDQAPPNLEDILGDSSKKEESKSRYVPRPRPTHEEIIENERIKYANLKRSMIQSRFEPSIEIFSIPEEKEFSFMTEEKVNKASPRAKGRSRPHQVFGAAALGSLLNPFNRRVSVENEEGRADAPPLAEFSLPEFSKLARSGVLMIKHGKYGFPHQKLIKVTYTGILDWGSSRRPLQEARMVLPTTLSKAELGTCFRVAFPDRNVDLQAESQYECDYWIKGLRELKRDLLQRDGEFATSSSSVKVMRNCDNRANASSSSNNQNEGNDSKSRGRSMSSSDAQSSSADLLSNPGFANMEIGEMDDSAWSEDLEMRLTRSPSETQTVYNETEFRRKSTKGAYFVKHGRLGKPHPKLIKMNYVTGVISWGSGEMKINSAVLMKGKCTKVFERVKEKVAPDCVCFSLAWPKKRTLDLQAASESERDEWFTGLTHYQHKLNKQKALTSAVEDERDVKTITSRTSNEDLKMWEEMINVGCGAIKHGRLGNPKHSLFTLNKAQGWISWQRADRLKPSKSQKKKLKRRLKLRDVAEILVGKQTKVFQRSKDTNSGLCLSVVTPERTLDLECGSNRERDLWVAGLETLIARSHGVSQEEDPSDAHDEDDQKVDYSESSDSDND